MHSRAERLLAILALVLAACGGGAATEPTQTTVAQRDDGQRDEPHDGLAITGLMGTISARYVNEAMEMRQDGLLECYANRVQRVEVLAGNIQLAFRIDVEGRVLWVYPKSSSIGDRETEKCILELASRVHFHRPTGGEAEFEYTIPSLDSGGEVRPAVSWTPDRVTPVLAQHTGTAHGCGMAGAAHVTLYVAPGGRVLAAGAAVDSHDALAQLDCVLDAVRGWTLPTPGSYPAKVSFDVD